MQRAINNHFQTTKYSCVTAKRKRRTRRSIEIPLAKPSEQLTEASETLTETPITDRKRKTEHSMDNLVKRPKRDSKVGLEMDSNFSEISRCCSTTTNGTLTGASKPLDRESESFAKVSEQLAKVSEQLAKISGQLAKVSEPLAESLCLLNNRNTFER